MRRRAIGGALLGVALLGGALTGGGLWIHAKAVLAQVLLHHAWQRTLAGERHVRPWPWADTWPVARLRVPSLDIDLIVLQGATGRTLAFGPGWHQGSAPPGRPGNSVLSAHRDTQFRFLKDLEPGDSMLLETPDKRVHTYRVTGTTIVDHARVRLDTSFDGRRLTLATCYPFDAIVPGGPRRYLVFAEDEDDRAGDDGKPRYLRPAQTGNPPLVGHRS